jgi:hypothetical protein
MVHECFAYSIANKEPLHAQNFGFYRAEKGGDNKQIYVRDGSSEGFIKLRFSTELQLQ